jgi:hypothetical protein
MPINYPTIYVYVYLDSHSFAFGQLLSIPLVILSILLIVTVSTVDRLGQSLQVIKYADFASNMYNHYRV